MHCHQPEVCGGGRQARAPLVKYGRYGRVFGGTLVALVGSLLEHIAGHNTREFPICFSPRRTVWFSGLSVPHKVSPFVALPLLSSVDLLACTSWCLNEHGHDISNGAGGGGECSGDAVWSHSRAIHPHQPGNAGDGENAEVFYCEFLCCQTFHPDVQACCGGGMSLNVESVEAAVLVRCCTLPVEFFP